MPSVPHWLIYPSLDLFAYERRDRAHQLELCPALKPPLQGSVRQQWFDDIRALHVNCNEEIHRGDTAFTPKPLDCVEKLQAHLLEQLTLEIGDIGKSWLLWGRLTQDETEVEAIAQQCYPKIALAPDADWQRDLIGVGRILGATLFELWHQPQLGETAAEQHVLICLFDYGQSLKAMEQLSEPFLALLGHRHQVLWLAARSHQLVQHLQQGYAAANQIVADLQGQSPRVVPNLDGLNRQLIQVLQLLHEYAHHLGDLQANLLAIAAHLNGYRRSRHRLYALDPKGNLAVLQNFDRLVAKRHWRPLKQAEQRLNLGVPCLENAVKMVEGAIAIEQLKSQQQLARTMVAASSSVSATAAAAVAIAPNLEMNAASPWQNFGRSTSAFLLSLIAGSVVGLGLWRCLPLLGRWLTKTNGIQAPPF